MKDITKILVIPALGLASVCHADAMSDTPYADKAEKEYVYNPMIEEGKTWTYHSNIKMTDNPSGEAEIFHFQFQLTLEGDTVIDGKPWKKCWYRNDGVDLADAPVVFLLEEGHKVYLMPNNNLDRSGLDMPEHYKDVLGCYIYYPEFDNDTNSGTSTPQEHGTYPVLLYDFDAREGDGLVWPWALSMGRPIPDFTVGSVEYRDFMGRTHILLKDLSTVIADGVGGIGSTDAVFICPRPIDTWYTCIFDDKPTLPWLETVSNASGQLLYDTDEDKKQPLLIREDRIWEYLYRENGLLKNPIVENGLDNYLLFRMRFDGTREMDGTVYHRLLYTGNIVKWSLTNEDDIFGWEETANDNSQEYLMREEDGKVYVLNNFSSSSPYPVPDVKEILVYDFNLRKDDSYRLFYCVPYWEGKTVWDDLSDDFTTFTVKDINEVEIDGEVCVRQEISHCDPPSLYTVIEGIGFCESGFLPLFVYDTRVCIEYVNYNLNRVYNAEGDIIYRGLDIDPETVSVEKVYDKSSLSLNYGGEAVFAENPEGAVISLSLLDISGKVMSRVSGAGKVSASTAALTPGVYVAIAQADGATVARRKFVVR